MTSDVCSARPRARSAVAAAALIVVTAIIALVLPVWPVLTVGPDDGPVQYLPLRDGEPFAVSFVHSLDHLPVEDWYHVDDGHIVQDSTRLQQFGAGMGHIAGIGRGQDAGEWWEITGMNRHIGELLIRAGSESVDHRLHHAEQIIPLSQCWAGQRVTVRPDRLSTLHRAALWFQSPGCAA
ncbi:DUF1850 domain-containing protein [Phytoactinopolyspora mesophila]|uniref:DUF1850 domain-containing protein n=1 Tax=Phytoactinopolyspora mesophila TaxID=2650750 RepID=A0A7K3M9F3_9ACTN|nr:DUF1850 domain-containing protein [Phytoactinopolyspora mesophila]NDL59955.1 DUF1850 domain-containing protein [Phytoactinopolyspora mesophila]